MICWFSRSYLAIVTVEESKSLPIEKPNMSKIYVGNLTSDFDERDLEAGFEKVGYSKEIRTSF